MPQLVAERVQPPVVVARAQLVLGRQVGDVGQLRVLQASLDAMVARRLDVAEQAAERQQTVVVQRLAVKHQHGVAVDRRRQLRHRLRRQRCGQIDPAHFADKHGVQLAHLDGHRFLRAVASRCRYAIQRRSGACHQSNTDLAALRCVLTLAHNTGSKQEEAHGFQRQGCADHRRGERHRPGDGAGLRRPRRQGHGGGPRRGRGRAHRRHHPAAGRPGAVSRRRRHQVRRRPGLREGRARRLRQHRLLLQQCRHRGQGRADRRIRRGDVRPGDRHQRQGRVPRPAPRAAGHAEAEVAARW